MNWKYFIGIDVSKLTLDICILLGREKVFSGIVDNHSKALEKLWAQLLKTLPGFMPEDVVCCLEHTGIYNEHLLSFLVTKKTAICLENPTHIKFSGGMTRGKNDQVDAERIAVFAYKERDSLRLWEPPRTVIKTLKYLSVLRIRLINAKKSLVVPQNEVRSFDKQAAKIMSVLSKSTLKHIDKDLINVENKILEIIKQDDTLKRLYAITTSVTGIGMVTAVEIIITTNEFKNIDNAQKYACYAGIAPFQHTSGTSVRGKTRVSYRANKRVKTLLHMAAMSAIVCGDLKPYYDRKVEEGKNKMLVINAVRNKLIHRIFSCINSNRMYEKKYQNAFA